MEKIIIVDDDPDIAKIAATRLRAAGYEVLTAGDGESGLRMIREHRPGVVVLDLMMPKMHGFAVCQEVRRDTSLSQVRVVITSAKSYPVDVAKAKELGADVYLMKPYDLEELVETVRALRYSAQSRLWVKFWGTRGSIATPGPATMRYGGNTSCVEVRCGDVVLMVDCGTGAREMGMALAREYADRPLELHLLISHTHWDHIQGFPFFLPAYQPSTRITLYSARGADKNLERIFTGQMDASYFPVAMSDLKAQLNFVELDGEVILGDTRITHMYLNHPGIAVGFRIESGGRCLAYVSDHEVYSRMSGGLDHYRKLDREVDEFAHHADLYIREAQYTDEEYASKKGWGHSTWKDAVESAAAAQVSQLALFHHDPTHDDAALDRIVEESRRYMQERGLQFQCFAAADSLQINL
jgi:phosphoribosyl 1,2-cyclic phosphodiesterase